MNRQPPKLHYADSRTPSPRRSQRETVVVCLIGGILITVILVMLLLTPGFGRILILGIVALGAYKLVWETRREEDVQLEEPSGGELDLRPLIATAPNPPLRCRRPTPNEEQVEVYQTRDWLAAEAFCEQLRHRGIPCSVVQGKAIDEPYDARPPHHLHHVMVWSGDAEEAAALLAAVRKHAQKPE